MKALGVTSNYVNNKIWNNLKIGLFIGDRINFQVKVKLQLKFTSMNYEVIFKKKVLDEKFKNICSVQPNTAHGHNGAKP